LLCTPLCTSDLVVGPGSATVRSWQHSDWFRRSQPELDSAPGKRKPPGRPRSLFVASACSPSFTSGPVHDYRIGRLGQENRNSLYRPGTCLERWSNSNGKFRELLPRLATSGTPPRIGERVKILEIPSRAGNRKRTRPRFPPQRSKRASGGKDSRNFPRRPAVAIRLRAGFRARFSVQQPCRQAVSLPF
jgi:hypothetical protein